MGTFKIYRQHDQMDCGPTCLRMIAKYYGRSYSLQSLRRKSGINRDGISLLVPFSISILPKIVFSLLPKELRSERTRFENVKNLLEKAKTGSNLYPALIH